ncbi:MAG: ribosomal RNA small subunit methyltransferase A [Verrucomicrobia bacterium]|nr:ribosomal RNA small subunit methyltransferase A [Verrucomicrobiota bacterium]
MTLSEMKQVLAADRIHLTKSLGQHFLFDAHQLRRMVEAARVTETDAVLEIGPGLGPLTELLVARAGAVLAIEKDARLVRRLRQHFENASHLTVIHADAVEYLRDTARDWRSWKVVANLPYSVTSDLLTTLMQLEQGPERMILTLQWEVACRLRAQAGQPDYGVLTLLTQRRYAPRHMFKIPRTCFFPEPAVDSAALTLERRSPPPSSLPEARGFDRLVRVSFSQRRKTLSKVLKTRWPAPQVAAAFDRLGLPPSVRAEDVALEQFIELTRILIPHDL